MQSQDQHPPKPARVGKPAREEPASAPSITDELRTFLGEFSGTQRELLAALEAGWLARLLAGGPAVCAIAVAVIRKKVRSRKLVAERDALVDKLFGGA